MIDSAVADCAVIDCVVIDSAVVDCVAIDVDDDIAEAADALLSVPPFAQSSALAYLHPATPLPLAASLPVPGILATLWQARVRTAMPSVFD